MRPITRIALLLVAAFVSVELAHSGKLLTPVILAYNEYETLMVLWLWTDSNSNEPQDHSSLVESD